MAQIGTIKLETGSGPVEVPVFDVGDSGSSVYEFVRVQTSGGTGFIPVVEPADASFPYLRVQTQNQGIVAVHNEPNLAPVANWLDDWSDNPDDSGGTISNRQTFDQLTFQDTTTDNEAFQEPDTRPTWDISQGSVSVDDDNGVAAFTDDSTLAVDPPVFDGDGYVWEIRFRFTTTSGDRVSFSPYLIADNDNPANGNTTPSDAEGIFMRIDGGDDDVYYLRNTQSSLNIEWDGWDPTSDFHTVKIIRDGSGNWEVIQDGTSVGTDSDSDIPSFTNEYTLLVQGFGNPDIEIDYFVQYPYTE